MYTLVLIRHGESTWNLENRFTGWVDVPLTAKGAEQARAAGRSLKAAGLDFDLAYTSVLTRAIQTLYFTLEEMERLWLPVVKHWQLNERHYGALQGLNKAETAAQYGDEQVFIWRRSYATRPPALELDDPRCANQDRRYAALQAEDIPLAECLQDTVDRVIPYWQSTIAPAVRRRQRIIISAHGNSLRALIKHLDGISDEDITQLNIPNGVPIVYELDDKLQPLRHTYLNL